MNVLEANKNIEIRGKPLKLNEHHRKLFEICWRSISENNELHEQTELTVQPQDLRNTGDEVSQAPEDTRKQTQQRILSTLPEEGQQQTSYFQNNVEDD